MGEKQIKTIRVYHDWYGCDTGCCGHAIEINGDEKRRGFDFDHPDGNSGGTKQEKDACYKAWAIEFAQDYIRKEYPECYDTVDWDSVDYSEVSDD